MKPLAKYLFRAFIVAPLAGAAVGAVVAFFAFLNDYHEPGVPWSDSVGAAASNTGFGVGAGGLFGLLFGVYVVFLTLDIGLPRLVLYLSAFTLLPAVVASFLVSGEPAIFLSIVAGCLGFWAGFIALMFRQHGAPPGPSSQPGEGTTAVILPQS